MDRHAITDRNHHLTGAPRQRPDAGGARGAAGRVRRRGQQVGDQRQLSGHHAALPARPRARADRGRAAGLPRQRRPTRRLKQITARLRAIFDAQGFAAGREALEAALREYPSSGSLKLVAGGLYYHYLSAALAQAEDTEQTSEEISARCLQLFEQGEGECTDVREKLCAQMLRINTLTLLGRYEEAEQLIDGAAGQAGRRRRTSCGSTCTWRRGSWTRPNSWRAAGCSPASARCPAR